MKKSLIILCLGVMGMSYSQVAIGSNSIHPSAAFEIHTQINSKDELSHGMLLPRVELEAPNNNMAPIVNPVDGCLVINTTVDSELNQGLYFWDENYSTWDRGLYSNETPKCTIINFAGGEYDYPFLDDKGAGSYNNVGTPYCLNELIIDSNSVNAGIEPISVNGNNTFSMLPGDYKITINFAFKFPPCDPANRCTVVANSYYYDGLFYDLRLYERQDNGGWLTSQPLQRKEDGVLAKVNEVHIITETYTLSIPDDGLVHAPTFSVGRMAGSSFNDLEYIIPELSFIKINKYK